MDQPIKSFSVGKYLQSVKRKLTETPAVWVHGVITQMTVKERVVYLSIAEYEEGNVKPVATLPLTCFIPKYAAICQKAENAAKPFTLREQIKVCFLVQADLYITLGKFQAQILDIDPVYTIGELAITRQAILKKLTEEGLLHKNAELELPHTPLHVGLITGESTAAYKDFTTRLDASPFAFKVRTEYAKMQGNETESTILASLERLQQDPEIDVVCIVRGGGSKTDLNYFDSEALCRAVANYPVPVFTGIGHEIDKSLLDEVAYLSCITPTDCAKRLVERMTESWQAMLTMVAGIQDSAKTLLSETREELSGLAHSLQQAVFGRIQQEKSGLAIKGTSLAKEVQFILRNESQRVSRNEEGLKQGSRKILDLEKAKFEITELKVKSASPETALARGYSFTLDANGKFIRSKAQVQAGDLITTRLSDGTVQSVVQ